MEKNVSLHNCALALEDIHEYDELESNVDLFIQARHLSFCNTTAKIQPALQVVKVTGSITVSF